MSPFDYLQSRLDELAAEDRRRSLIPREVKDSWLISEGRRLINFGSNDYLGLSHPIASDDADQNLAHGNLAHGNIAHGSGASSLVCGWTTDHERLAGEIASFESTESAVVFPTGYAACSGTVATLAEAGDLLLSDQLNHASLIDGCRLSRATRMVYPHRDSQFIAEQLRANRHQFARVWIVTDGVFSMDGHIAPLPELVELAERYDAHLIVDEAHGTGVLGAGGRGVCELFNIKHRVPIRIGTLSKAVGSQGGFVAAPKVIIDYLVNRCRSLIYSTALAPSAVNAARQNLRAIAGEPHRREKLNRLAIQVRESLGLQSPVIERGVPIIPIPMGSETAVLEAARQLASEGFYVPAIRPPTVPSGTSRLRVSLSASHSTEVVTQLCESILARKLKPLPSDLVAEPRMDGN